METDQYNGWETHLESRRFVLSRNARNLTCVSVCEILLGIFNLMFCHWTVERIPRQFRALYLGLQIFILLFGTVSFAAASWARQRRKRYPCNVKIYGYVFLFVSLLWGSVVTLLDQTVTFMVIYVLCTALLLIAPAVYWKLQAAPLLVLLAGMPWTQSDSARLMEDYSHLAVLVAGMGFLNYHSYLSWCRNGISRMEMGRMAVKDELTGLYNRRKLRMLMEETVLRREMFQSVGIIMFDIDYFKKYNDYYGHSRGDRVLTAIGTVLNELSVQYGAFAARYGGEEFIVILRNRSRTEVSEMAENIKRSIADLRIENHSMEDSGIISVSIGTYWIGKIPKGVDFSRFIERADAALYKAKRSGRDRICKDSA